MIIAFSFPTSSSLIWQGLLLLLSHLLLERHEKILKVTPFHDACPHVVVRMRDGLTTKSVFPVSTGHKFLSVVIVL